MMTELTKRGSFMKWTDDTQFSFKRLKKAFCEAPLLEQFKLTELIYIETDASNFALLDILSQKNTEGHKHLMIFFSWKLTKPEHNYETPDHELLTIVMTFKA